jgi:CRP-like cAMP-binding protein
MGLEANNYDIILSYVYHDRKNEPDWRLMANRRKTPVDVESIEPASCSVDLRLSILQQLPFFAGLSQANIQAINDQFHEYGYKPGETIYHSGDRAANLYVVAAGKIKLLRHTLSGQDVLLNILVPGDFFGSLTTLGDEVLPDTAQAQTAACVLAISAERFRALLRQYPSMAVAVLDITAARLQEAQETVRQLSAHPVEQRLAVTLLKLADKLGQPSDVGLLIQMPLSREDLAQMTGTSTETVSRIMSQFLKDGIIQSGRQWVAVRDRSQLEEIAQG